MDHPDWEVKDGICMCCVEEYRSVLASKDIQEDLAKLDQVERELVSKIAQRLHLSDREVSEYGIDRGYPIRSRDSLAHFSSGGALIGETRTIYLAFLHRLHLCKLLM